MDLTSSSSQIHMFHKNVESRLGDISLPGIVQYISIAPGFKFRQSIGFKTRGKIVGQKLVTAKDFKKESPKSRCSATTFRTGCLILGYPVCSATYQSLDRYCENPLPSGRGFCMVPLAVPGIFLAPKRFVICRPLRNKSSRFFRHRRRSMIYSHSMVPMGLGVRSIRTRLIPSTSWVIR